MKKVAEAGDRETYAAFLRGVNVGGHNVVKMDALRQAFEALGFSNVKTVLASGNVLFDAPAEHPAELARKIALGLREACGRELFVIVRTLADLRALSDREPFEGTSMAPGTKLFVTFLPDNAVLRSDPPVPEDSGCRIVSVSGGIVCSVVSERPGVDAVYLMGFLEKNFGRTNTTRTWNTVARLIASSSR